MRINCLAESLRQPQVTWPIGMKLVGHQVRIAFAKQPEPVYVMQVRISRSMASTHHGLKDCPRRLQRKGTILDGMRAFLTLIKRLRTPYERAGRCFQ